MLEWIVTSSILIAVIITLRYLLRGKISLRIQYALWGLVLLRLLIPFSIGSSGFSVMNTVQRVPVVQDAESISNVDRIEHMADGTVEGYYPSDYMCDFPTVVAESKTAEEYARMEKVLSLREAFIQIWLCGAAILFVAFAASNGRFASRLRRTRRSLDVRGAALPVYISNETDTPCLFGLFRPAIYVTPEAAEDATILRHTVEHETTHFHHGDNFWSILRGVCLVLHWYNPLAWWAAFLSRRDAELACDEATINRIGEYERAEYGRTLIAMTCHKRTSLLITATTMTGSRSSIKERIMLIAKKPKMVIYTLVAVVLVAAIAVGCTFTGAKSEEKTNSAGLWPEDMQLVCAKFEYAGESGGGYKVVSGEVDQFNSLRDMFLIQSNDALVGDWLYRLTLNWNEIAVDAEEYVITVGETCLSVNGVAYTSDGYDFSKVVEWFGGKYDYFDYELTYDEPNAGDEIANSYKDWSDEDVERWRNEVTLSGFSISTGNSADYDAVGHDWAEAFVKQYVESTSEDSPVNSNSAAVLTSEPYAESLIANPKTVIYNMRFACEAADKKAFERWFVGWAGPLNASEYPQYEGWMEFGWFIVLQQSGDGGWSCIDAGTGGYGGWGFLNYEEDGVFDVYMEDILAGNGDYTPENVICCLPFVNWREFDTGWGAEGWNALWKLLNDYCLTEGQVYGPEETRMWLDVYPDDQTYRNMYVILTALNTDGAYSEGIGDILKKQRDYDPELFERCLQENLTSDQRNTINILIGMQQ